MDEPKPKLSNPLPIRLPVPVVEDLKRVATKNQRSLSQELRFRVLDSWSRIQKKEIE
jgi:hypothetical protein